MITMHVTVGLYEAKAFVPKGTDKESLRRWMAATADLMAAVAAPEAEAKPTAIVPPPPPTNTQKDDDEEDSYF